MKDSGYFQNALDERTKDLSEDEKVELDKSLNNNKDKEDLKSASQLIAEGSPRNFKVDLNEFLVSSIYYRTLDHTTDVLEYEANGMYIRVAGKIALGTFVVDEFYVNTKPLKDVENVEMSPDLITEIKWK